MPERDTEPVMFLYAPPFGGTPKIGYRLIKLFPSKGTT